MPRAPKQLSRKGDAPAAHHDNASPSPAYEAKGLKLNLVLLSKSDQAPAPAYTEKPCSLVGLALRGKPSQAAPEEISKNKEVPRLPESLAAAEPLGADLSESDPSPELDWAATKIAEMEWEENLKNMLLAEIAHMDAVAEAKAAAEAADKIVDFDGVSYVKAW